MNTGIAPENTPIPPGKDRRPLDAFFAPRAVAVIGASEKPGSVGRTVFSNLLQSPFGGTVYPINPRRRSVLGVRTFPSVQDTPEPPDLALIITPAPATPEVIRQCAQAGVQAAIIISAGFYERGPEGQRLLDEVRALARAAGIRLIGPNSLGIMNPASGLNAAYNSAMARRGSVAFASQSGALCASILDWSLEVNAGFSAFVSFGAMADVGWPDILYHLGSDPHTKSIVLYMQSIGDARSFLSAAREVALAKPIIVLKAGRTPQGIEAGAKVPYFSRGEAMDDAVLDAAFRRSGILRVDDVQSLFQLAEALGKQPRPKGPRLLILSNAAGPGVLAADALTAAGGELTALSQDTLDALNRLLPPYWSKANPIDIVADASPERYTRALETASKDPGADGVLVVLTPQVLTQPTETARQIAALPPLKGKPLLASWMGGPAIREGDNLLNAARIPTFAYPDAAARVFNAMWRYAYNLRGLYETPAHAPEAADQRTAALQIAAAHAENRLSLNQEERRGLLEAYRIPTHAPAPGADGVPITLRSAIDPHFGPVLILSPAGALGMAPGSRALGLPPLNTTLARRMMEQTSLYRILARHFADTPALLDGLAEILVHFSSLVAEQHWIREAILDPLIVSPQGLTVQDSQVHLFDPGLPPASLPRLAIRPYPGEYLRTCTLKNGQHATLRPIRPEDEALLIRFHENLSQDTVYFRYLRMLTLDQRIRHDRLAEICFIDYDRAMALVALDETPQDTPTLLGIARMVRLPQPGAADFALLVADAAQGQGLGQALLAHLAQVAREEGLQRLTGTIHPDNRPMLRLCKKLGFTLQKPPGEEVSAVMEL